MPSKVFLDSRVVAKTIFDICRWAAATAARAVSLGCCMYVQEGLSMMWFSTLFMLGQNLRFPDLYLLTGFHLLKDNFLSKAVYGFFNSPKK